MPTIDLATGLHKLKISFSDEQLALCMKYLMLMQKWNRAYNLTAITNLDDMIAQHLLDSLAILPHLPLVKHIADVGTGAGLPGIVLAIFLPDTHFSLIDSNNKKVRFLVQCQHELLLKNIDPIHTRVEAFKPQDTIDIITSRAYAPLAKQLHECQHLFSTNTRLFAMKGPQYQTELQNINDDFLLEKTIPITVPFTTSKRYLLAFQMAGKH